MASVTFESFIGKQGIEIPAIQRDYVQGRGCTIEEQDKREAFVIKLINAISNDFAKPCHLEFIYGTVNEVSHCFIPLDGQQRLTTLFLLHWVVWNKSSSDTKEKYPLGMISNFKYETRLSSLSFCKNIIEKELLIVDKKRTLGEQLKKQPWFAEDWNFDPTISAMISMIDYIESRLNTYSEEEISKMLIKLCSEANYISFEELNMADYDLTDSLYIKMNARGKFLTPFENWKSDFIKFLETEFGQEQYGKADKNRKAQSFSYKDYFCYSIEHEWTDLFWNYLKEEYLLLDEKQQQKQYPAIDKMFMNLFDFLCIFHYYCQEDIKVEYNKANAAIKRKVWQNKKFVDFLFGALDALCRINHGTFFDELFYISEKELPLDNSDCKVRLFRTKRCNLFEICVNTGASMELTDMLLFYSLLYYCDMHVVNNVDDRLKSYMRNVRNYFETDIQNIKTRTIVQLNLRASEFNKYVAKIQEIAKIQYNPISISECIIDDCSITHGYTDVFKASINSYGTNNVVSALMTFCNASQSDRVRLLIANGFKGTYLSDCIGRRRFFFGNKEKWDVLFISDQNQLSECFKNLTEKIASGKDASTIIQKAISENREGFVYYMLNYEDFLNANDSQLHFAVKGELDDVDWIALGSYSSNPGTAYHVDPLAATVEKELVRRIPKIKLALYKQYSGKCPLSIVKDKNNWEPLFSIISKKDGWHITHGFEYVTEDLISECNIIVTPQSDNGNKNYILPFISNDESDMVQLGTALVEKIWNNMVISIAKTV